MNPMEPAPTPLDLRWRLLGIGFRVHPMFWFMNLLFGYLYIQGHQRGSRNLLAYLGFWVGCAFVSILVHELGHVLAARTFGERSNIVLYSMGGLALGDFHRLARWQRILVALAGPAAGFGLCAFAYYALPPLAKLYDPVLTEEGWFFDIRWFLVLQNFFWSAFNLLPIMPLDGGMVMKEAVTGVAPAGGLRLAYGLSFLFAGCVAVYSGLKMYRRDLPYPPLDPLFNVLIFAMFAMNNYMAMQSVPSASRSSRYEEKEW